MLLQQWLQQSAAALSSISDNPLHEIRLMLCRVLQCSTSYLFTYPERPLSDSELAQLTALLDRRLLGEPLAYIFGSWHFYGLELRVAPCTLIPRPDTEILVEQALALPLAAGSRILDLGTGTGAIALALAANRPDWLISAVDLQDAAVSLAQQNARVLHLANVSIKQSSWFSALQGEKFQLIVSNPPYIEAQDPHLAALAYEPITALVAADAGLADIKQIIHQAPSYLTAGGWLWLEHGYNQAAAVQQLLNAVGFSQVTSVKDYGNQLRISGGQLNDALS